MQFVATPGELAGRAEHIVSGESARFSSLADLLDFLQGVLLAEGHAASAQESKREEAQ